MTQTAASSDARQTEARPAKLTPYDLIGGEATVKRLAYRFYEVMDSEPGAAGIRAMHGADLAPIQELLFEFLSAWLGGPALYFQRPKQRCIMSVHTPFAIGEAERDQWMMCMRRALDDCAVTGEVRTLLDDAFLRMANHFRRR